MKAILTEITTLTAIVSLVIILIACIANDLDHGIIYSGLVTISGLGGYTIGRVRTEKIYQQKQKPPDNSKGNLS